MSPIKWIASVSLFIIFIWPCGTSHHLREDISHRDKNFTMADLKEHGIHIGGFSSKVVELNTLMRLNYSTILSNTMLKNLKDSKKIRLTNTTEVIKKVGRDAYIELMESYDYNPGFKSGEFQLLKEALPQARYLLVAYIENENIIDNSYEEYVENYDGEEEIETEYQKIYLLSVEYLIYDLIEEKPVYKNTIFNEASKSETRSTRTGCFESCVDNLIQEILFGEAAEIDRAEVIEEISSKFTKALNKI